MRLWCSLYLVPLGKKLALVLTHSGSTPFGHRTYGACHSSNVYLTGQSSAQVRGLSSSGRHMGLNLCFLGGGDWWTVENKELSETLEL